MSVLHINGARLWNTIMLMAEIGATDDGGCNRQALTTLDQQGRDLFVKWSEEAGCTVSVDEMGNIFARRPGRLVDAPPVITGSHLDTQPTGGKFDGVYGVLGGLEVIRTLNDEKITTDCPIEVVCWTNEEGARFSPAMIGSGVWSGEFDLDYGHTRQDKAGITIKQALSSIGYLGDIPAQHKPVKAAFELHIEQGPILETNKKNIGVVSGVQGMNWYDITLKGTPCHAGPSPMDSRQDPFMGLNDILENLYKLAAKHAPWSRVTFGDLRVEPGARNTVPETLVLATDLRHPNQEILDSMDTEMRAIVANACAKYGLGHEVRTEWRSPAVSFDTDCINAVKSATSDLQYSNEVMFSGAGHDAVYVSKVAPTSMIFIPCEGGISHNPLENADAGDIEKGCNVLANAMLTMASKYQ